MKKRIVTLLCTTILTLGLAAAPAMASAGPYSPIEVEAYTYGPLDELRVNKVYRLSQHDDPSGIPTEDFVRGGRRYYLLGIAADSTDHEVVTYTAVFGSAELTGAEKHAGASGATRFQPFDTDFAEKGDVSDLLPFWVCTDCMAMAACLPLVRHRDGHGRLNCVICFVFTLSFLHELASIVVDFSLVLRYCVACKRQYPQYQTERRSQL